jgi:hypothetical protein
VADLNNFSISLLGSAAVNVPRIQIEAQVLDSTTGAVLNDFMGANAIIFPAVMTLLSNADRRELADVLGQWLVRKRAGLPT